MRFLFFTIVSVAAFAGIAYASDLSGAFGNTVITTDSNGIASHFYINSDNTYTGTVAGQQQISGTWAIANGEVCFDTTGPDGTPIQTCSAEILGKNVGDNWSSTDQTGTYTVTIVAGIQ